MSKKNETKENDDLLKNYLKKINQEELLSDPDEDKQIIILDKIKSIETGLDYRCTELTQCYTDIVNSSNEVIKLKIEYIKNQIELFVNSDAMYDDDLNKLLIELDNMLTQRKTVLFHLGEFLDRL